MPPPVRSQAGAWRRDKAKNGVESYSSVTKSRPQENSAGLAIAEMSDAYSRETLALKQEVESYVNADPYDPERPKIVAALRKDGATWVAKYARGGSARKLSARRVYIAIDALQGHLASNGVAILPKDRAC
ncbi:hypothetical protein WJX81_007712 [Elliptochloris bilobata]|uniref:Uncharacterized protein n=1 Tax=Elliptochloris bilobata TaxID=381761 RepID=A0AAW1QVT2_9CHLO